MVLEFMAEYLDAVLNPLTIFPEYVSVMIVATMITLIIMGLNRVFINRHVVKEIKKKMEEIREKLAAAQKEGNKEEMNRYINDLMKTNNQYMKHTFKTLIISLAIVTIFLPWLNFEYGDAVVAQLPFKLPVLQDSLTWLYWYVLASFAVGWVIRKIMGSEI